MNEHFVYGSTAAAFGGMRCPHSVWEACVRSLNTRMQMPDSVYTLTDNNGVYVINIRSKHHTMTCTVHTAARMYVTGYIAASYEAAQAAV